jgi:hypothetical protein
VIELLLQADRLLNVDQLDQAEVLYRRAADQDPQNAIAVVGIARCEAERGHDAAAYEIAVRALAIDPHNNMALRMEARLSEVLAARGEPVERPAWMGGGVGVPRAAQTGSQAPDSLPARGSSPGTGGGAQPSNDARRRGFLGRILGR